ncbi:MAG: hypothetical protein V7752_11840 [Halopseudomonas sp.]
MVIVTADRRGIGVVTKMLAFIASFMSIFNLSIAYIPFVITVPELWCRMTMACRKLLTALLLSTLTPLLWAADWKPIDGIYAVTAEGYLDPAESDPKDSHYRLQLQGQSAEDLYLAMKVEPEVDECTGGWAKNVAQMQCLFFEREPVGSARRYECHFSIDIAKQSISYGVAC